jgi:uncharacterized membrane protein HdeD (DUF308 family)
MGNREARYLNILLGVWLFISAFLWRHSSAQFTNTWLMGAITVVVGLISLRSPAIRFINTLVGIWLVISGLALPAVSSGTRWNNVLVGVAIFLVSLVGSGAELRTRRHVTVPT